MSVRVLVGMSLCVFMCVYPRASEYTNLGLYVCENVWVRRRGRREEEGGEEQRKEGGRNLSGSSGVRGVKGSEMIMMIIIIAANIYVTLYAKPVPSPLYIY